MSGLHRRFVWAPEGLPARPALGWWTSRGDGMREGGHEEGGTGTSANDVRGGERYPICAGQNRLREALDNFKDAW